MKFGIIDDHQSLYLNYQLHWSPQVFIFIISLFFLPMWLPSCLDGLSWWRSMCCFSWIPLSSLLSTSLFRFLCFYLHFELVFFTNPPVTAESGECAFLKYFIFSSSSGTAVDWACSSFLKSHIRFKTKTWGDVFLV